jgi:1-acyl-sn-glycerol-3-phosphate acyltransferase
MLLQSPLTLSNFLLSSSGVHLSSSYQERIPAAGRLIVVSNHRSFMDAPILMAALGQPIRFACHHYMGQVPVLRDFVKALGCFPLESAEQGQLFFSVRPANFYKPGRR